MDMEKLEHNTLLSLISAGEIRFSRDDAESVFDAVVAVAQKQNKKIREVVGVSFEEYSELANMSFYEWVSSLLKSGVEKIASSSEVSANLQEGVADVLVEDGVEDLMEMAMNLRQSDTGLPVVIWVSTQEAYGSKINHGPRIKVMSTRDQKAKRNLMYSMDVEPPYLVRKSQDMRLDSSTVSLVRLWVKKNSEWLKKYWEDEISVPEFLQAISPDSNSDSIQEDSWAADVGKLRSGLGEIQENAGGVLKWTKDYDTDDVDDALEHVNLMRQRMMDDPLTDIEPTDEGFEDPESLLPEKSFKGKKKGWLKALPRDVWAGEMKAVHGRDYDKLLKLPELNSAIVIADEIGDGFGRAILAYALGEKVYVQRFEPSDGDDLFEMSNLKGKTTGLPLTIWVSAKNANHGPRVKVQWGDSYKKSISISIHRENPTVMAGESDKVSAKDLHKVTAWIVDNYEVLMSYWRQEIDTAEMVASIKVVRDEDVDTLQEDSWAADVGKLRSELGEIEEIYKDFDAVESRIGVLIGKVGNTAAKAYMEKSLRYIVSGERQVELAYDKLYQVTKTAKEPRRNPIQQSAETKNLKAEMVRVSNDIGLLSVRVRNVGQAVLNDVSSANVKNVKEIADIFEKASETVRKGFVQFEKSQDLV